MSSDYDEGVDSRSGVEAGPVIPDGEVVLTPPVTDLDIVVLGNHLEEVVYHVVRFVSGETQYPTGESRRAAFFLTPCSEPSRVRNNQ